MVKDPRDTPLTDEEREYVYMFIDEGNDRNDLVNMVIDGMTVREQRKMFEQAIQGEE